MRILFLGARPDPVPSNITYQQSFEATGRNTGNLLIGAGLKRQLAFESYAYGQAMPPEEVNEKFDLIAIAAANFIFKGFDFSHMADYLEKTTLPILCVGLGAQMPSSANPEMEIPEGSRKLLKILGERCIEIGVRGEFTASVLAKMGVKNTSITGCPSYYWHLTPEISVKTPEYHPYFDISVNGSRNVTDHSFDPACAMELESSLIKFSQRYRYDYVMQNEYPEFDVIFSEGALTNTAFGDLSTISRRHQLRISPEHYAAYLRTHGKVFFDIDKWADYIGTKDLSIGSRFHGNLIALLNGVPAILFAHDSRTIEMAEYLALPYWRVDDVDFHDVRKLYEEADFRRFENTYTANYVRYVDFLNRNNARHTLG